MVRSTFSKVIDTFRVAPTLRFDSSLNDLECLSSGCEFERSSTSEPTDRLDYLWFEVVERPRGGGGWHGYRVIKVSELKYLPQEARADPSLIRKQSSIVRGLYAAGIESLTLHYGIFDPPLGIVQCYGATARHEILEAAVQKAANGHTAVIASMSAQYPQSRFASLAGARVKWLWEALHRMPRVTALVGQPDPREGARGGGQQQTGSGSANVFSEQQNELFFRALARAREEFLFLNIATPIARRDVAAMLESLANLTSPIASRQQGSSAISFGVSLPVILNVGQGQSAMQGYQRSEGEGTQLGVAESHGKAHTEGVADSNSWSHSHGIAQTEGVAETDSVTHTSGITRTTAVSQATSENFGTGLTQSQSHTVGQAETNGTFASSMSGGFASSGVGSAHTETDHAGMGSVVVDLAPAGLGLKFGYTDNITGPTISDSVSASQSSGSSWASASGASHSVTNSEAATTGVAASQTHNVGVSEATTNATAISESTSVGHAVSHSQAVSNSEAWSQGGSHTKSAADTLSESETTSAGRSYTQGLSTGRGLGVSQMQALGAGVAPSASVSKSFQWKDEAAITLTKLLEQQVNILNEATEEGGFYSDVYILTRTANGQRVAEATAIQSFGGSQGVVTHLQPRRPESDGEREHLLKHARTFTPSTVTESLGWINGYAYSSIVTPTQQSAYSAPGLFEEGTALTVQERIPPFAFYPDMPGDTELGVQFSTERGEFTNARLRLARERHQHTLFTADTRFGKTIGGERLAVEVVNSWQQRVVVLDFGAGWRRLINGPLPHDRVDLYQLYAGAVRPLRWNPLQIGKRISPDRQYAATSELIANAGRMGERQLGYIKKSIKELYIEAGVMTAEPAVYSSLEWGAVRDDEVAVLVEVYTERGQLMPADRIAGKKLLELLPFERQAIAVHRSKKVTLADLYNRLKAEYDRLPASRQTDQTSLKGILLRLEIFTSGELALMYSGAGSTAAIEDLGLLGREPNPAERYGLCIVEGGAEMDEFAKAVILGLLAWHLYTDSVIRRRETIGGFNRPLNLVLEEANKLISGAASTQRAQDEAPAGQGAIELWQSMFRDGLKYLIYLWVIAQTVSELPPGIVSSCNNAFIGQLKSLNDRKLAMGIIARSELGFTDEEYKRFVSRMPAEMMIAKLGYSPDVAELEPLLCKFARVPGVEPSEAEILERFGGR